MTLPEEPIPAQAETPQIPTFTPEEVTQALINMASALAQVREFVKNLIVVNNENVQYIAAHKKAIVDVSKELNRVAEELNSQDARIDVMRSWLKSLGPEPTPLTGVAND